MSLKIILRYKLSINDFSLLVVAPTIAPTPPANTPPTIALPIPPLEITFASSINSQLTISENLIGVTVFRFHIYRKIPRIKRIRVFFVLNYIIFYLLQKTKFCVSSSCLFVSAASTPLWLFTSMAQTNVAGIQIIAAISDIPNKNEKIVISVRIEKDLIDCVDKVANKLDLSRNEIMCQAIKFAMDNMKDKSYYSK